MKNDTTDYIGEYAAKLSVIEISLGSLLHGFKIPLTGQILSLNQGAILTHMLKKYPETKAFGTSLVSNICAVLKSLSPAGKKLGPMLSISMQGQLYAIGVKFFGINSLGVAIGMGLLSLWAFLQPFITYYLFFGHKLIKAFLFYMQKIEKTLGLPLNQQISLLLLAVLVKVIVGMVLGILVYRKAKLFYLPENFKLQNKINLDRKVRDVSLRKIIILSLKDLLNPLFIGSFILMVIFFVFSRHEWSQIIWYSLRPLAIAFIFFFLSRHPTVYQLGNKFRDRGKFPSFFKAWDKTLEQLRSGSR